ncbi:beta strand repeat-containing protein [Variovorax sp. LARHSF232]
MNHSESSMARRAARRELRLTPLALSLICLGLTPALAQNLPVPAGGGANLVPVPGGGSVELRPGSATVMNIQQNTPRAIAEWQSFSIASGSAVFVNQLSNASVLLNRVKGSDLSTIAGTLKANGHVYLVNPNGVLFSAGSSVSVGGLIASTLDISNTNFMDGKQLVFERGAGTPAKVENYTSIAVGAGGTVGLFGDEVINAGNIDVARGSVGLVSARKVTVDFDGDGLTRFTIPADSAATSALVNNTGSITADGGRIALMAASTAKAQVVNQSGVLRANSIEQRNGEIVLSAGVSVDNEGRDVFSADSMRVSGQIEASGGRLNIRSGQDITVFQATATAPTAPTDGGSIIDASVLSDALDKSTSVMLESAALRADVGEVNVSAGFGVRFDVDAQVIKNTGGNASFTVNSTRNIGMASNSALVSSSGALNVDFNADAKGILAGTAEIYTGSPNANEGGAIVMNNAVIASNGGDVRFYGQSDPVNGRAVGSFSDFNFVEDGIAMSESLVSTCAAGQTACTGGGAISLRGQGISATEEGSTVSSGNGVYMVGSSLLSGSGAISVDGRGALGASGVLATGSLSELIAVAALAALPGQSSIESTSGDIRISGDTRGWRSGESAVVFDSRENNSATSGAGVTLNNALVSTGNGNVSIDGTGADLTALGNDAVFQSRLLASTGSNSATVGGSHGVLLNATSIVAGAGRQIAVSGKAGSAAFTVNRDVSTGVLSTTPDTGPAYGVQQRMAFGAGFMQAEGGRIVIDGRGTDVSMTYSDDSEASIGAPLLSVASQTRAGGSIEVRGRDIQLVNSFGPVAHLIDASGAGSGGSISFLGSGAIALDQNVGMRADAVTPVGSGGTIRVVADGDLRSHGSYSARAGASGGNGGLVETSGHNVDLTGIRVDASAAAGQAGTWLIDPFDVNIVDGVASGSLPTNPFEPIANSTIQDGDINDALNKGTSVTIGTGVPDATSFLGNITFDRGVEINLDTGETPVTFRLDAGRSISSTFGDTIIQANSAPLNVEFNAGVDGASGSINYDGLIRTNGGNVTMRALGNGFSDCGICMSGAFIDTRVGGLDSNPGGNVSLTVPAPGTQVDGFTRAAIDLDRTSIFTSSGDVAISGFSQSGTGVRIASTIFSAEGSGSIQTTSGDITITGVGAFASNSADAPGHGVSIDGALLSTVDGNIAVRGLRQAGVQPGTGVSLRGGTLLTTTGSGDIEVTGESLDGGAGVLLSGATTNEQGQTFAASRIDGNRHVVLRAANNGSSDALAIDGTVRAGQVLNLRPGGVDAATGAGVDRTANTISLLGGSGATGFAVSSDEMARMTAAAVVVGSSTHAGNIDVLAPMASSVPLTLQNGGGGNINLQGAISAPTLSLISGGNITQAAGAAISAGTLLAQSSGGNVILADPGNNVSASTLGGGAAGRFEFVNSAALRVGPVSVTGWDAAGNLPQVRAASSMAADTVLIRTLSGELILASNVSSSNGADLVAATTFQNAGGSMSGAPWRIWADTWVGETRGGLVGSGQFPNLYHCAYLGLCTVTVSPGDNHFIYAQQPSVTVTLGSFSRSTGQPNPAFTYTLGGLILGDTGVGITGTPGTTAGLQSPAGSYPVFGTFTSAEGYLVNVVPGRLLVSEGAAKPLPVPARFVDVLREEPTTYLYDRNIGQAPICLASGPLEGDRAQQGNDLLAREWSRVRTRPNLTSCLDTERQNGCSDF